MPKSLSPLTSSGDQLRHAVEVLAANGATGAEIEQGLIAETLAIWKRNQSPPPLSQALWQLNHMFSGQDSMAENITRLFHAHHQINLYTFQSLHSGQTEFASLLEDEGDICQSLATEIFMAWYNSQGKEPVQIAREFLDKRFRQLGFVLKRRRDQTDLTRVDAIVSRTMAEDMARL